MGNFTNHGWHAGLAKVYFENAEYRENSVSGYPREVDRQYVEHNLAFAQFHATMANYLVTRDAAQGKLV